MTFVYLFLCFMIPNVLWQFRNRDKVLAKKDAVRYIAWTNIYWLYCAMAIYAAGIGTVWDIVFYRKAVGGVNLIPFSAEAGVSYLLNVIMLMPFGFLLPFIWREYRDFGRVCLSGFCFSLLMELLQLFAPGVFEVDALLMNTLGSCIGYGIWKGCSGIFRENVPGRGHRAKRTGFTRAEPMKYLLIGLLSIFLLYNCRALDAPVDAHSEPVYQESVAAEEAPLAG